ncbi:unnamed protein product [Adineta steineri]|uniref:MRH domain-containing protein n=1 Tax=Adineta steineri TaxID=433720 RepID=A0A819QSQ2_9BILA|nr:unnamed protein product [Adineta steineri]CAF1026853.1 unnamed protein product [Adineta steineri]CAF3727602.1 unnamed protein product [Adineta steineri]CAF4028987.1 unnamed protein product [Adineta steineri]
MRFSFFTLILLFAVLNTAKCTMDSCHQTFGSNKYDLNRLSKFTLFGSDDEYDYALTLCDIVKAEACHGHTVPYEMSCQYNRAFQMWSTMAFLDGKSTFPPNLNATYTENPDGPGTGVFMTTNNGDPCFGRTRYMRMKLICDKTVEQPTNMTIVQWSNCDFHVEVRAIQACPIQ